MPISITINNLAFKNPSSHTYHIYHFYFTFTASNLPNALIRFAFQLPIVIPQREQLTYFGNHITNTINNTNINYPNIFRLVSANFTDWQFTVQPHERRLISIFAFEGWNNLYTTLHDADTYPAATTLNTDIQPIIYKYKVGAGSKINMDYPLDWDRLHIILNGE